jgi:hypothetical protein
MVQNKFCNHLQTSYPQVWIIGNCHGLKLIPTEFTMANNYTGPLVNFKHVSNMYNTGASPPAGTVEMFTTMA